MCVSVCLSVCKGFTQHWKEGLTMLGDPHKRLSCHVDNWSFTQPCICIYIWVVSNGLQMCQNCLEQHSMPQDFPMRLFWGITFRQLFWTFKMAKLCKPSKKGPKTIYPACTRTISLQCIQRRDHQVQKYGKLNPRWLLHHTTDIHLINTDWATIANAFMCEKHCAVSYSSLVVRHETNKTFK